MLKNKLIIKQKSVNFYKNFSSFKIKSDKYNTKNYDN